MVARISAVAVAVSFFVGSVSAVPDGFSLVPDTSCGARANCYEGPAHDLARIMQLDPLACKRSVVRPGSCEDCKGYWEYDALSLSPAPLNPALNGHQLATNSTPGCATVSVQKLPALPPFFRCQPPSPWRRTLWLTRSHFPAVGLRSIATSHRRCFPRAAAQIHLPACGHGLPSQHHRQPSVVQPSQRVNPRGARPPAMRRVRCRAAYAR